MKTNLKSSAVGIAFGLLYGVSLRLIAGTSGLSAILSVMTVSFLLLGPLIIGWTSIRFNTNKEITAKQAFFLPFIPVFLGCLITWILNMEGLICIAMYLPLGSILAGVGGVINRSAKLDSKKSTFAILILPFVVNFTENNLDFKTQLHVVQNAIEINSSANLVWKEIKSVRTIQKDELPDSWVHKIGFPRPLSAEIDKESIGGIRMAHFERGLQFIETVDQWQPDKLLSFKIDVDPQNIPPQALDEHVTIGGPYFDVLHGTYEIENLDSNKIRLHLKSEFRLSTHFNFYAGVWTNLIMHQIQSDILSVIKNRAEASQKL
jgi:hypothetical protein